MILIKEIYVHKVTKIQFPGGNPKTEKSDWLLSIDVFFSTQALTKEQAEYCMSCMETYVDKSGRELPGYFDYKSFVDELFVA